MAARAGATSYIDLVELLVQESDNANLSADQIQDILDQNSQRIIRAKLFMLDEDGEYWQAPVGRWEGDTNAPTIKDEDGTTITHTADLDEGIFTLTTPATDQVYLWNGRYFDVYGAAHLCCHILIAKIKGEYSATLPEGTFSRTDRIETLEKLAKMYEGWSNKFALPSSDYELYEVQRAWRLWY